MSTPQSDSPVSSADCTPTQVGEGGSALVDRRFLLGGLAGVAGVAALAAMGRSAQAGPLNPPAGAVTPTGRTLDEIYNRIPAGAAFEGRTPISPGPMPAMITISSPGSYVLTGNITYTEAHAILITADNVDLDLNGFVITGSPDYVGVLLVGPRRNIRVRNGVLRECTYGVSMFSAVGVVLEDLRIERCRYHAINASGVMGSAVRRCTAIDTGATTTPADGSPVTAIFVSGNGNSVDSCTVSGLSTFGVAGLYGIYVGVAGSVGNSISNCVVSAPAAINAAGVFITGTAVYRGCTVSNVNNPYAGGTNGGGNF